MLSFIKKVEREGGGGERKAGGGGRERGGRGGEKVEGVRRWRGVEEVEGGIGGGRDRKGEVREES